MFHLDSRLASSCHVLANWPLSQVLLKNEKGYPWFILVPRQCDIEEIHQLSVEDSTLLMQEINQLALLITQYYKPDKVNVAALGNIVSQLHVHVVARFQQDALWPQGIWQTSMQPTFYTDEELEKLLPELIELVSRSSDSPVIK